MTCVCGHPFGEHGDRAIAACQMPVKIPGYYYKVQRCGCTGWRAAS